ncbi:MAG TPA: PAS domain-containing protein [Myxococcales bacterium]|jgi:PAS domain S-box-containing protein|nr:PAS domain-containing protein [Myxococcales bacterium]
MMSAAKPTIRYAVAVLLGAAALAASWGAGPRANAAILVLFCLAILLSALQRTARDRADEQLHFQSQLLAQLNDAVVAIDCDKRVIYWGGGAEVLYGIPAREALGKPAHDLYDVRWPTPAGSSDYERSLAERGSFRGELIHVLRSGREMHVETTAALLKDAQGRELGRLGVIRDITDRKRAERESAANEARLRVALGNLDMAVFSQDRDLRYTWVFRPQLAPPEGVIDKTDLDMLERLRLPAIEKVIAAKRRVLETGVGVRTEIRFGEGADARWYDLAVEPIRDPWGAVVGVTSASLNVSERRRAEERVRESREELRALTARLQSIREEEQARIARDLHDELGQLLTALKMGLRSLEATVGTVDPQNASGVLDRVVAASEMVDQTLSTIRRIATELRPGSLDRLGLVPALRQEIRNFEERTGIPCEASLPEQLPELDPSVATALYRICQEAMTNVHRHAMASRVAIRLQMDSSAITLQVEDDGRGFEPTVAGSPQALGLLGMVERAEGLEGHVYFQRADGRRGTLVTASIPVGDAQAGLDRRQAGAAS